MIPENLKKDYQKSEKFVRQMDQIDGGLSGWSLLQQVLCIESALIAGLSRQQKKKAVRGSKSEFDALVMLDELRKQLTPAN